MSARGRARDGLPRSLTAWTVRALVRGQVAFDADWCDVWSEIDFVLELRRAGEIEEDFRPEALEVVVEYLRLYEEFCEKE